METGELSTSTHTDLQQITDFINSIDIRICKITKNPGIAVDKWPKVVYNPVDKMLKETFCPVAGE